MSTRAQVGDLYVMRSKRFDLWCTLQIIEVAERVSVVALPGMLAQKPTLASAPRGRAFGSSYYFFANHPQLARCTLRLERLETEAEKIGTAPRADIDEFPGGDRPVATLAYLVRELDRQRSWDAFPEACRSEFAQKQRGHRHVGNAREAVHYVEENPVVYSLRLDGYDDEHVDLSRTSVRELELDITGVARITLPKFIEELELYGDLSTLERLRIHHPLDGDELELRLSKLGSTAIPHLGLPQLTRLRLKELNQLDLGALSRNFPKLQMLGLWGRPGTLDQVPELAALSELRELMLVDLFGFSADDFPLPAAFPKLDSLTLVSVPKDAGKTIKQRFAHLRYVDVAKLRGPDWMAQNVGNPFRSWEGRSNVRAIDAKAAFKAYAAAQKQLAAPTRGNGKEADVEQVLKAFVTKLNQLATKSALETQERDEAVRAFHALLEGTGVPATTGDRWWEQWEDF